MIESDLTDEHTKQSLSSSTPQDTKSIDNKTYSIETYEKRFQNSLKQLNAPKWFSMAPSSSTTTTTSNNSITKSNNTSTCYKTKYEKDDILKMLNKTSNKVETPVSAHKLKYERLKQRYRMQQKQKGELFHFFQKENYLQQITKVWQKVGTVPRMLVQ